MKFTTLATLLIATLATGCDTLQYAAQAPEPHSEKAEANEHADGEDSKKEESRADLEHKLKLATDRLDLQEREMEESDQQFADNIRFADVEVHMAQAKLDVFRDSVAPQRLASEGLNLASTKDRAQQAADELAQIEIMYKDQDLDDLTAEFVVSRGRRNAERAAQRIEIQEAGFARLKNHELPSEEQSLALAVEKAASALQRLHSDREIDQKRKAIALEEASFDRTKLEKELSELNEHEHGHDDDHDHDGDEGHDHDDGHDHEDGHEHSESEAHEDHQ
jgi:hypothetical protein